VHELVAKPHERTLRRARLPEHVDQVGAALDELEQASVGVELLGADLAEKIGGAADVEALLRRDELRERGPQRGQEGPLAGAQPLVVEAAPKQTRPELQTGDGLVQVVARPLREPRVHRLGEVEEPLRHAAGGRDHDDHHELRLQQQDLHVPHVRRFQRGRRDEREQPRHLGEHLRRRLQRRLDLGARRREVEREGRRLRLESPEQLVGVMAVALLGRHASCGRVRMREQPEALQLRQLGPDG